MYCRYTSTLTLLETFDYYLLGFVLILWDFGIGILILWDFGIAHLILWDSGIGPPLRDPLNIQQLS